MLNSKLQHPKLGGIDSCMIKYIYFGKDINEGEKVELEKSRYYLDTHNFNNHPIRIEIYICYLYTCLIEPIEL